MTELFKMKSGSFQSSLCTVLLLPPSNLHLPFCPFLAFLIRKQKNHSRYEQRKGLLGLLRWSWHELHHPVSTGKSRTAFAVSSRHQYNYVYVGAGIWSHLLHGQPGPGGRLRGRQSQGAQSRCNPMLCWGLAERGNSPSPNNITYIILINYSSLRGSASPLSHVMPSMRMSTFLAYRLLAQLPPALKSL